MKAAYVEFALKLSEKRVPLKAPRSNIEIMDQLEEVLLDRYEEEKQYLESEVDIKKIIH